MILMLNCSFKAKSANTEYFFQLLEDEVSKCSDKECKVVSIRGVLKDVENGSLDDFVKELKKAKAFVIGAPLYVDGLPSQAVKLLELLLDNYKGQIPKLPVYVVSNLGFYESEQIKHLLSMVENWCIRMGMAYGGGLAIGAGPMVRALDGLPVKKVVLNHTVKGIKQLATAIVNRKKMKNYYTKTVIPRIVYLKAAHKMFDETAIENGLKVEEVR